MISRHVGWKLPGVGRLVLRYNARQVTKVERVYLIGALLVVAGCGGSPTPTAPPASTPTLRGTVSDPVGDSLRASGVAISPDLVSATIEVSGGNLTATMTFAPGTLSRTDTFVNVLLNTDENLATGHSTFGWDYAITGVNPRGSTTARIVQALGSTVPRLSTLIGTSTVTFIPADQVQITVPLSLLGNDEGRLSFRVESLQWVDGPIPDSGVLDVMPDAGLSPGLVR